MVFKKHIISRTEAQELLCNEDSQFMEIDGLDIHYRDQGQGEPLLLIHGFAASLHNWDLVVDHLKDKNRVIRFDVPGFGLSTTNEEMNVPEMVQVIRKFLDNLGIEKANVVGSSMGGWISWEFAVAFPDSVNKLVLMNAAGYFDLAKAPTHILAKREKFFNFLAKRGVPKFAIKLILKNAVGGDKSVTKSEFVEKLYKLLNIDGNLSNIQTYATKEISPSLDQIETIPHQTLIMWGDEDKVMPIDCGKRFNSKINNSKMIVYPGVGHIPMIEVPNKVVSDLTAFLS